jgi:hydrogenase maturation factor
MIAKRGLPAGKLPVALLRRLLAQHAPIRDPRLLVGPGIGLDAAAVMLGSACLVLKSDPITFVSEDIGTYALTINANDLATMGATPRWFLATVLLPAGTTAAGVSRLFAQLAAQCRRLNVTLAGGHSEITPAVTRPVVAGFLLGECPRGRLLTTAGAKVGDAIVLTKGIPIEAVSVLAIEQASRIQARFGPAFLARCRRYLETPGVSILREAGLALQVDGVHAMHDPTEGGLSAALYELAEAAGAGMRVEQHMVPILPEGARLCAEFGVDPWGAIASGALLIAVAPARAGILIKRLAAGGITAARIGTVLPRGFGVRLVRDGRLRPLPRFPVDEIARVLGRSQSAKQP